MTAICDLSDLPETQCACRIHGPQEPTRQPAPGTVVARTAARYPGHCRGCGDDYQAGTPIALVGSHWVHEECVEETP